MCLEKNSFVRCKYASKSFLLKKEKKNNLVPHLNNFTKAEIKKKFISSMNILVKRKK